MAISSIQDLLALSGQAVGRGVATVDALQGEAVAPELRQALSSHEPRRPMPDALRQRLAAGAREAAPVEFGLGLPLASAPIELPPGGWDVLVALRLRTASEALAAVQANGELPSEVALTDQQRLQLAAVIQATLGPLPPSDPAAPGQVVVGTWHLGPPRVEALPGAGTTAVLTLPYTIDVEVATPDPGTTTPTEVTGELRHAVEISAALDGDRITAQLASTDLPDDVAAISIAADSLLQPPSPEDGENFVTLLTGPVTDALRAEVDGTDGLSASPILTVPVGSGLRVRVQRVDLRLHQAPDGDVMVIGALIGEGADPADGVGDPDRLVPPRLPAAADVWARVDAALLDALARQALDTGELQRVIDDELGGDLDYEVRVDAAAVEVEPAVVRLRLDVTAVDVCAGFKDVKATVAVELRVTVANGRVQIERSTHVDKDDSDTALCALVGLVDLVVSGLVPPLFFVRLFYYLGMFGGGGGGPAVSFVSGVIDPGSPIPNSESLPTVEVLEAFSTSTGIESLGSVTLRPDDVNTYLYLHLLEEVDGERVPLDDVAVTVVDQDVPRPPGDRPPKVPEDSFDVKPKVQRTTTHAFVPPRGDDVIVTGRTDALGNVRFRLSPADRATTAGSIRTTTTTTTIGTFPGPGRGGPPGGDPMGGGPPPLQHDKTETHTTTRAVPEATPDLYLRVQLHDGAVVDSRTLASGFFPNVRVGRIGAPEEPVELVVARSG